MHAELLPGSTGERLGEIALVTFGRGAVGVHELVTTDVGGAGDVFTGAAIAAGHHPTDARLLAAEPGAGGAGAGRGALTHRLDLARGAPIGSLVDAGVGGASDGLAGAGLIAGDLVGTAGAGATHHLGLVGDAEAHFGGLGGRPGAAETVVLLAADVFIAGDQAAAAGLIAGDPLAAADAGAGDAGAAQGIETIDLGRSPASDGGLIAEVLVASELETGAGLITGHLFGASHHHPGNGAAALGLAVGHLAG